MMTDRAIVAQNEADSNLPATLQGPMRTARAIFASGLIPEAIKTPQQLCLVLLKGRELGLHDMESVTELYVIYGRVCMSAKLMAARFRARGNRYEILERTDQQSVIRYLLRTGETMTMAMTMTEALQAGWPANNPTNWKKMPATMLTYRNLSTSIRALDPGSLMGTLTDDEAHTLHEVLDPDHADGETIEGEAHEMPDDSPEPVWADGDLAKLRGYGATEQDALAICGVDSLDAIAPAAIYTPEGVFRGELCPRPGWHEAPVKRLLIGQRTQAIRKLLSAPALAH